MLARARRATDGRVAVLAAQDLVEADGAVLEGDHRARQVEQPGSIRALAGHGARLVRPLAQPLDPLPAGPRVMQAQALDGHDLEARGRELRHRLPPPREARSRVATAGGAQAFGAVCIGWSSGRWRSVGPSERTESLRDVSL